MRGRGATASVDVPEAVTPDGDEWSPAERAYLDIARRAREDPVLFCAFVLRDEETGRPIELTDFHAEWHDFVTKHDRAVILAAVELGKTWQTTIGRTLWELGRHPEMRGVILGNTAAQAEKNLAAIARYVLHSEEYHAVFPHVQPSSLDEDKWNSSAITIHRPASPFERDPSLQAVGLMAQSIRGSRVDWLAGDDVLSLDNTWTKDQREKTTKWLRGSILDRMTRRARGVLNDVVWHPQDPIQQLIAGGRWTASPKYTALVAGQPRWAQRYSDRYLALKRQELGPSIAGIMLDLDPRDASKAILKPEWLTKFWPAGPNGEAINLEWDRLIQSWDMAFLEADQATSYVVGQVWGAKGPDLYLLDQIRAKMGFVEACSAMRIMGTRWPRALHKLVEKAANGPAIAAALKKDIPGIDLVDTGGKSKAARLMAVEGLFAGGNVWLPPVDRFQWVADYLYELQSFTGAAGEQNDQVDATSQALLALHAHRQRPVKVGRHNLMRR